MHIKNRHNQGYNFNSLVKASPELSLFIIKNKYNNQDTIDFSDPLAVKSLNLALLKSEYNVSFWDIPDGYLCPAIPGRVDYIHYLHDLLSNTPKEFFSNKTPITVLDIGTGASCIYPILGQREYNWNFVASDIDPVSVNVAKQIIASDKSLDKKIDCRLQVNSDHIFNGIISETDFFHLTLCNPPFHNSLSDANQGTARKWKNLNKSKNDSKKDTKKDINQNTKTLNFGGQKAELWCQGGELAFIEKMINESKTYRKQVVWFTCLVSKKDHLRKIKLNLNKAHVSQVKVINMTQGQKISRFIAWSFYPVN